MHHRKYNLKNLESRLLADLKLAPPGSLEISSSQGKTIYRHYVSKKEGGSGKPQYLSKKKQDLIKALAQKDYLIQLLHEVQIELDVLSRCTMWNPQALENVFNNLPPERKKLVLPFNETDEMFVYRWLHEPYKQNPYREENLLFTTIRGEKVRSKSEKNIADSLTRFHIPYKYEKVLELPDLGMLFYPDFTILDIKTRKEVYWEHFGLMDDSTYANKAIKKINYFTNNNLQQGIDYLFTMESSTQPLDQPVIDQIIRNRFL